MLLREGKVVAAGTVEATLTSATISTCFDHPVTVRRHQGRWSAVAT